MSKNKDSFEDLTMRVAKEIFNATQKSEWFDGDLNCTSTMEWFENNSEEIITTRGSLYTIASRKKVLGRFLELLTSINATYDEPTIAYKEKYRTKKIHNKGTADHSVETVAYNVFEDATMNVSLDGLPAVRILIAYDPQVLFDGKTHRLKMFVLLMKERVVA